LAITVVPVETRQDLQELHALVSLYYDVQAFRVRANNRQRALERLEEPSERIRLHKERFAELEKALARDIAEVVAFHPVAPWLLRQRGIGPIMAAALIASDLDPNIDKPSAWWRFAGVGVVDGKNQRLRRGQKRSYNGFLRRTLHVLLGQFLKAHTKKRPSFYADLYYQFKDESRTTRPGLADIHHHKRAALLTMRVFLTHLQQRWREALGLPPPRVLYIVAREGGVHQVIEPPP
jgi:hypothetical protein